MSVQVTTPALTAVEARELTDRIRSTLRVGYELITEAFHGCAWSALGYAGWDAYCAGEFAEARMVRLEREQRREIVGQMRATGMSTRAISSGLGLAQSTVADDVRATDRIRSVAPANVTSLDGRQRLATQATNRRPQPESLPRPQRVVEVVDQTTGAVASEARPAPTGGGPEPEPQAALGRTRRPLPDAFFDAAFDLSKAVDRVVRLAADDRFPRNANQVAAKHRSDLERARDALAGVLERLS